MDTLIKLGLERQQKLDMATADFIARGGVVTSFGQSETARREKSIWRPDPNDKSIERRKAASRERHLEQLVREHAVVKTKHGEIRRTAPQLRDKLRSLGEKMTTPAIEQLATRLNVLLAAGGRT